MAASGPEIPFFYQMKEYSPISERAVPRRLARDCVHFTRPPFDALTEYFRRPVFERVGVLRGEYALINGQMLIRRDGTCIKANMALEEIHASERAEKYRTSDEFLSIKAHALESWDQIVKVDNLPVLSHPYPQNYFHWTCETVTKMRFFNTLHQREILVMEKDLARVFQRDLLARTIGGKTALIQPTRVIRVKDPVLSHDLMSDEAIHWLRKTVNINVSTGPRRIYLRRTPSKQRTGAIIETLDFVEFLREFGFETVEFTGELTVHEQVKMLDCASVILAAHGAGLTNTAYLSPPLSIIEVIGVLTQGGGFYVHLSSILGFQHFGICLNSYDNALNIGVHVDELRSIMKSIGA
jgi:hypothetical protein